MSLLNLETYDALKAAGTPEPEARQAAMEVATMGGILSVLAERVNGIDSKLTIMLWIMGIGFSAMLTGFGFILNILWQITARLPR
jgi:hypothetical protein